MISSFVAENGFKFHVDIRGADVVVFLGKFNAGREFYEQPMAVDELPVSEFSGIVAFMRVGRFGPDAGKCQVICAACGKFFEQANDWAGVTPLLFSSQVTRLEARNSQSFPSGRLKRISEVSIKPSSVNHAAV